MTRPIINPGVVDWSGENPGMYLRETADGPFVTLISYFRVVLSPKGRGHAAFILQDPHGDGRNAAKPNLCITDNEPMAEYLRAGFVANFGAFKGIKGLGSIKMVPGWDFMRAGAMAGPISVLSATCHDVTSTPPEAVMTQVRPFFKALAWVSTNFAAGNSLTVSSLPFINSGME